MHEPTAVGDCCLWMRTEPLIGFLRDHLAGQAQGIPSRLIESVQEMDVDQALLVVPHEHSHLALAQQVGAFLGLGAVAHGIPQAEYLVRPL